jgi:AcrR family transcriptional regulator
VTSTEGSGAASSPTDGRHRRRERSRAAIVDASLALVRESGQLPSARRVAERTGLTERTVFNLFEDKTRLMLAVVAAFRQEAVERIPAAPEEGTLDERVERFFEQLTPFLEDYCRVRWAVLTSQVAVPDVERGVVLGALYRRIRDVLAGAGVDVEAHPELAAPLRAAVDPLTWRLYRVQQRLSMAASRDAVVRTVLALAAGARP